MALRQERMLENQGYSHKKSFNNPSQAKEFNIEMRKKGFLARYLKSGTNVIGYYSYDCYVKQKDK